ncbi:cyclin-domain-containing [Pyrrhoderma noxium]|uniref:Cyclin-domain-containing n=1 Tax=Pyrrhoderma noxium TaxID=2282107 RepID=A0A286UNK8_9AGAM|nr:cyclin-domain-containing [Pyrrhoderma noxium]
MLALAPAAPLHDHSTHQSKPVSRSKSSVVRRPASASTLSSPFTSSAPSFVSVSYTSSSSNTAVTPNLPSRSASTSSQAKSEAPLTGRSEQIPTRSSAPVAESVSAQLPEVPMPANPTLTSTPVDISTYPTPDLLHLLASILNQIAVTNDGIPSNTPSISHTASTRERPPIWNELFSASRFALSTPTSPLTFHARNIPSISLEAYLLRILRYCPTANEVFLSLLVYFDRMSKLTEDATGSKFIIDSYNVHRLVIAGVTVASKFFSDVFYTNSRYAKVGGLPQAELNQLELQFLLLNDFHLSVSPEELQCYADELIRYSHRRSEATPVTWNSVFRPMQSMGAIDAFGGTIGAAAPDDQENSSIYSETDTDAETDDEPTIRPAYSCASSDTQSLFSSDASTSEDGGFDDEDEGGDDDDDDGSATDDERPNLRRFGAPTHHRWDSNASSSVGGEDRLMTSP